MSNSGRFSFSRIRAERKDAAHAAEVADRKARMSARYTELFDLIRMSSAALVLADAPDSDRLIRTIGVHVSAGYGVPSDIEEIIRIRILNAATAEPISRDGWKWFIYQFLKTAVGGLPRKDRKFAWALVEAWERDGKWSDNQHAWAERMLHAAWAAGGVVETKNNVE